MWSVLRESNQSRSSHHPQLWQIWTVLNVLGGKPGLEVIGFQMSSDAMLSQQSHNDAKGGGGVITESVTGDPTVLPGQCC